MASYLSALYAAGKSPSTCSQIVAALRFRAKLGGTASPTGPGTERVLSGIRRLGRDRGRGQVTDVSFYEAITAAAVPQRDSAFEESHVGPRSFFLDFSLEVFYSPPSRSLDMGGAGIFRVAPIARSIKAIRDGLTAKIGISRLVSVYYPVYISALHSPNV